MKITFEQIQRELTSKVEAEKKLKKRISTLRMQLTNYRKDEKRLIVQYERLVKDWRIRYEKMMSNGWKIVGAKISIWYSKMRGE